MIRRGPMGLARFQLLHGWWIAIAQNVAPGRFHARERRRIEEDNRRVLSSSDIPTFALAGAPSTETATRVVLTGWTGMRHKKAGILGLRRFAAGTVTSLHTTQPTPGSGELRVTSQRRRHDIQIEGDFERALMIHNFLGPVGLRRRRYSCCTARGCPPPGADVSAAHCLRGCLDSFPDPHQRGAAGLRAHHHWRPLASHRDSRRRRRRHRGSQLRSRWVGTREAGPPR
jgi:hypothetical protein